MSSRYGKENKRRDLNVAKQDFGNGAKKNFTKPSISKGHMFDKNSDKDGADSNYASLLELCKKEHAMDVLFGFERINDSPKDQTRVGWLINMHPVINIILKILFSVLLLTLLLFRHFWKTKKIILLRALLNTILYKKMA